jgi:flavin-binding protein dodecin
MSPKGGAAGGGTSGSVARVTEISARSDKSFEDALRVGVNRASTTLRNVTSAWVKEQRVDVKDGRIQGYQVNLLITFVLDE